ncbi:MAG: gamma-glutamyltransferase, partial [Proteobacteria bacterium]|nr:gamma-glutamyltransferase [Pseudomonadota bacterium]
MIYLSKRVCSFYWLFLIVSLVACVTSSFKTKTQLVAAVEVNRSNNDFRAISNKGMVVAAHHLSAEAGAEILERGGNAADAAVASSFVISVVRPHSTGLGGGGFLLYFDHAERKTKVYDFRERAPKAATRDLYYDAKGQPKKAFFGSQPVPTPSMNGHRAVAVPGLVRGLIEFHRLHGRLKLAEVMAPAIRAATLGFPIYPTLAAALDERKEILKLYASSKKIFFRDGRPLRQGEVLIQSDLAATLTEISEQGDAVFYQGSIAEKIVAEMKRGNGLVTASDLSGYAMLERQPLSGTYHGRTITSMPPPSSGGVHLIQMLNILESDDLPSIGRATSAYDHLLVEAMRRAFAD